MIARAGRGQLLRFSENFCVYFKKFNSLISDNLFHIRIIRREIKKMEALAIGMATKAIQIIAPYVKKGFEKFAGDFDDATANKVKGFFETIKKRLIGDDFASKTMEKFEEKPESYMESAKDVLKDKIMNDKTFKTELEAELKELGPIVDIFQDIKVVKYRHRKYVIKFFYFNFLKVFSVKPLNQIII